MCCFRRAVFLTFITITAISESSCLEKSSNRDLSAGTSLEETSETLSSIRTRRKSFLSEAELKGQLELAKVNGLKRRFKRFSCWHSCLGPFYRKIIKPSDMLSRSLQDTKILERLDEETRNSPRLDIDGDVVGNPESLSKGGEHYDVETVGDEDKDLLPTPHSTEWNDNGEVDTSDTHDTRRFKPKSDVNKNADVLQEIPEDMPEEIRQALEHKKRSLSKPKEPQQHKQNTKKRGGVYYPFSDGTLV